MASNTTSRDGHLDAFAGREVVYCHQCENEWYRDDYGLICPRCEGEATEIVTRENDPRTFNDRLSLSDFDQIRRPSHDSDSDPDEGNINDYVAQGPGGFFGRRTIFTNPQGPDPRNQTRATPDSGADVIRRFAEMLGDLGAPPLVGRSGEETLYGSDGRPSMHFTSFSGPGFTGGVSTFSITSSGGGGGRGPQTYVSGGRRLGDDDPFQSYDYPYPRSRGPRRLTVVSISPNANRSPRVFGDIFGRVGPPPMERDEAGANRGPGDPGNNGRMDMGTILQQLFSTMMSPNGVHGDAVYSQEALDRIITQLMETNPQSNAPPPASADTIAKLPRKKLDAEMLGPDLKGECTICIDDMKLGDEAVVLPCKHWFHEECVVLWLKEHNTCPICRTPVDGAGAGPSEAGQSNPRSQRPTPASPSSSSARETRAAAASQRMRDRLRERGQERLRSIQDMANPNSSDYRRESRRNSNSPPYQAPSQPSRVRSPSPSSRSRGSSNGSGGGPLSWIRDQFSRGDRRR